MPQAYIITAKDGCSNEQLAQLKKDVVEKQGGKITHEYTLIKAFAYVTPPLTSLFCVSLPGAPFLPSLATRLLLLAWLLPRCGWDDGMMA